MTIEKTFDPAQIEARWYPHWEGTGLFHPARDTAQPFTIVMPPPNVTGSLHIGHALDVTLQDILVRHARLQGKDALWVVGTDHAGIATQMVVERNLAARGIKRADLTRAQFVGHVWEWKAQSGGAITRQLRRLGASCDWANERFTMDAGFSRAVVKVFVELHRQGLLYRDKRLVNWDPHFRTAISDLEVETREVQGSFWHLTYPLADGSGTISVATTRPETMLADMAVAVHPEDARYAGLVGRQVRLPITGRLIPIIADDHADPALGSGAVKITPGHDFNDFEVGIRAGFKPAAMLNLLDAEARIVQTADGVVPADLIGLDRFEARTRVVARLEAEGALEKVEARVIQQPTGDRSGVPIEPWLTDQWYVDAKTLAGPALEAVRSGDIRIVPETWKKTWYNWLENIQPWCVSRQLWWGHQIPAWYGPDFLVKTDDSGSATYPVRRTKRHVFVAEGAVEAKAEAEQHYRSAGYAKPDGDGFEIFEAGSWQQVVAELANGRIGLLRDTDVLDTWFSSALWPFGTLGWPGETASPRDRAELLRRHYPNDVLISGFDILFFWDARMAMQGLHFMGERPWKTLYLHGLVRDAHGQKMSKSKGNTVDPIGLIERYGADALRFTLAAMESQGRDIKLDERRVEGYRNFATKLWNAARFAQGYGIGGSDTLEPPPATLAVNQWIVAETQKATQALDLALADLRFDEAANTIYHFVWDRFCDWYLELIKPAPVGDARGQIDDETKAVAGWVLDQILVLLHPFMPFLTEELWHALAPRAHDLIVGRWPMADARAIDPAAVAEVEWLIGLIQKVRTARGDLNVPPSARPSIDVKSALAEYPELLIQRFQRNRTVLARMARFDVATFLDTGMKINLQTGEQESRLIEGPMVGASIAVSHGEATYYLGMEGVIDLAAERERLGKSIVAIEKERDALAGRLGNAAFVEKAKPEAVAKAREDHAAKSADAERLRAELVRLG